MDEVRAAASPRGRAPAEAELKEAMCAQHDAFARIARVFRHFHSGVVTLALACTRLRGLAEAGARCVIRGGEVFAGKPTPSRGRVRVRERQYASWLNRDSDVAG